MKHLVSLVYLIEETLPFNQSEIGGAIRKAIDDATEDLK